MGCKSVPGTCCLQTQPSQCPGQCQEGSGPLWPGEGHMEKVQTLWWQSQNLSHGAVEHGFFTPPFGDRVFPIPGPPPTNAFIPCLYPLGYPHQPLGKRGSFGKALLHGCSGGEI